MEADYPHSNAVIGGEGEGEKKSMMTKVKDKAKKIKDNIKKHGGHGHDHEEEEDDAAEETVNDVHGAPVHESSFISGTSLPKQTGLLEKPAGPTKDPNQTATIAGDGREATKTTGVHGPGGTGGVAEGMYDHSLRKEAYGSKNPDVSKEMHKDPNPTATIAGDGREATKTMGVHNSGGTGGVAEGMYDHSLRKEAYGSKNPEVSKEMHNSNTRDGFRPDTRMPLDLQDEHHNSNEVYEDEGTRTSGKDNKMPKIPELQDAHHNTSIRDEVYTGVEDDVTRTSAHEKFEFPTSKNAVDLNESSVAEPAVKIGSLENMEEDPHSHKNRPEKIPPSNYQSKVVDPTGQVGREADVSPLVEHFDNLHVGDESASKQRPSTGSHDQFAPESAIPPSINPDSPKMVDPARPESGPRDTIAGKISSATYGVAGTAVSAKNAVASKLGYGGAGVPAAGGGGGGGEIPSTKLESPKRVDPARPESVPQDSITGKVSSATVSAKNAVASKLGYGGAGVAAVGGGDGGEIPSKKPESPKRVDPARPESGPQDSITGKISSATYAIAGTAVSAKNVVASKLGYGEAGAAAAAADGGGGGGEKDKGVSVKEYFAGKLSPGEEDRALSEAITDSIQKRKGYKPDDPISEDTGSGPGVVGRVKGWLGMGGTQDMDQDKPDLKSGGDVPVGGPQ